MDHAAGQGYDNASFEVGDEECLDITQEFCTDEAKLAQS
ncbi:hypothetical protein FHR28_001120 [Acinetobacter sp. BIGb0196]|nr:hypothetical protein [Acinetobacter guillouiae]MCW2251291.1 hypothetical protein [Acinetobacter sp. BIGb0204]NII36211.1 hypothetical protein [Acinetobacter sp. BIGb0196]